MKFGGNFERKLNQNIERPPIAAGDAFKPEEELKSIRRFPKEKQRQKLTEFKEKLAYQKEGLASVQEQLVKIIRANPDMPFRELYERAIILGDKFGINEQQKELAAKFLRKYAEKHARIKEVLKRFPDNKDLYEALFGVRPRGRIGVMEGPVTLYFRCQNLDDYARIYSGKFFSDETVTKNDKNIAKMSGGVKTNGSPRISGLEDTIIAEKAGKIGYWFRLPDERAIILEHEEQHAIEKLLQRDGNEMGEVWGDFLYAETSQKRKSALEHYLVLRRQAFVIERMKDEILAFFSDGKNAKDIFRLLVKPAARGGLYDHNEKDKKYMKQHFANISHIKQFHGLAETVIDDVYGRGIEYKQLAKEGLDAIFLLKKAGYSRDKAIFLLIHEPLPKWKKVVSIITRS